MLLTDAERQRFCEWLRLGVTAGVFFREAV